MILAIKMIIVLVVFYIFINRLLNYLDK